MSYMKIEIALTFLFFLIISIVSAEALSAVPGWEPTCLNSTHLLKKADIYLNNTLYDFNQTLR